MPVADPPPAYTSAAELASLPTNGDPILPAYAFPNRFAIGGKLTEGSLVDIPSIKGHLALLNAFAGLKEQVEQATFDGVLHVPKDSEAKWAWFVGMAAERFDRWCLSLSPKAALKPIEDVLPPLDVMMMWHSYMLNPRWYAEDGRRIPVCRPLQELGNLFGKDLHLLPALLRSTPSEDRMSTFHERVLLPYDPFQSVKVATEKQIRCPRCRMDLVVPFLAADGTGYLQPGLRTRCRRSDCLTITKDTLCARKLAENLSREGQTPYSYLPGTFFTESRAATQKTSDGIIWHVRHIYEHSLKTKYHDGVNEELCLKILKDVDYRLPELRAKLAKDKLIGRIMSAHLSPMVYSVDLVGAVLRQGSFVKKMTGLGWTLPGHFDNREDELALQHALARYHAFLDLLSSSPASFFVPTLDIDLVWHTHQLWSAQYNTDCRIYVGRFIDHDDKIDGVKLSSSFDITCRAWKDRFGVRYTHCGCPPPGDTIGQRLSRFVSAAVPKTTKLPDEPVSPSMLVPPAICPDLAAGTHASEHNSVQFVSRNDLAHRKAETLWMSHQSKLAKRLKKEERYKNANRDNKDGGGLAACGYGLPFILPVPLIFGAGVVGGPALVDHGGACGNGNGVCGGGGCSGNGCGSEGCGGGCGGAGACGGGGGCGGGCGG